MPEVRRPSSVLQTLTTPSRRVLWLSILKKTEAEVGEQAVSTVGCQIAAQHRVLSGCGEGNNNTSDIHTYK